MRFILKNHYKNLFKKVFQKVALHCEERNTLVDAVDEFLSQIVVIPPAKCSTEARWTRDEGADESVRKNQNLKFFLLFSKHFRQFDM